MAVPPDERFLVTGALGCVGAWTMKLLAETGTKVVGFDRPGEARRLRLIMGPERLAGMSLVHGDITDRASLDAALDEHAITNVIHLAALQVPFARADPPAAALVNVVGTVNVFEAVKRRREHVRRVVYAGSVGMFDAADADPRDGRLHVDADAHPRTHYGVYKLANEGNARVYWQDDGLSSVGLRPMTVYGPGRDQGLTSAPTRAILAAVAGRPFEIAFGGRMLFQYAPDVARAFIAASRSEREGALVYNLAGSLASIDEFIAAIERVVPGAARLVSHAPATLPFPEDIDASGIEELGITASTPLREGVAETAALFEERIQAGEMDPEEHGASP